MYFYIQKEKLFKDKFLNYLYIYLPLYRIPRDVKESEGYRKRFLKFYVGNGLSHCTFGEYFHIINSLKLC